MMVVFQTSVAPFVQQVGQAFAEAGLLERFYTTLYAHADGPRGALAKILQVTGLTQRRMVRYIPADRINAFPLRELIRLAAGRIDSSGRLADLAWESSEKSFARRVASRLRAGITGLYGYEFGARAAFVRARELGIRTHYDVPAPEPNFVHGLLDAELDRFPEMRTSHDRFTRAKESRRTAHRQAEWELADVVIAASHFTRESFAQAGRDVAKVRVVPYGAPTPAPREDALARGRAPREEPLRFVWAGTFGVRKGAHYLLEAWRRGNFGRAARLDIFGSVALPARALSPLPAGVTVHGPIPHHRLVDELRAADALIFPTLCDGFGMVATEAWSQGTPVLTTARAGAFDFLRNGENGYLMEAASSDAIEQAITACIERPDQLRAMREAARETAARWQWSDYRKAIVQATQ